MNRLRNILPAVLVLALATLACGINLGNSQNATPQATKAAQAATKPAATESADTKPTATESAAPAEKTARHGDEAVPTPCLNRSCSSAGLNTCRLAARHPFGNIAPS